MSQNSELLVYLNPRQDKFRPAAQQQERDDAGSCPQIADTLAFEALCEVCQQHSVSRIAGQIVPSVYLQPAKPQILHSLHRAPSSFT